jgi:DHA1 family bicyclomycin/chloramphenicol resistance-like MFS transporter
MALAPFSENAGSASALIGFLQMVCGAILSAIVSALHDETLFPMVGGMATAGIVAFVIILRLNSNTKKGKINPAPIPVPVATKKL